MIRSVLLLLLSFPAFAQPQWKPDGPISAKVLAVGDGDTLTLDFSPPNTVKKLVVRLRGIDAPEKNQKCLLDAQVIHCGRLAQQALSRLVLGRMITCSPEGGQSYGRMVGICVVDGDDINAIMARQGWAVPYVQYSKRYVADASDAQIARRGLWAMQFERPQCYRKPNSNGCPCVWPECKPE